MTDAGRNAADELARLSEDLNLYDKPYDATLLGLASHALSFTGHVEDMSDDKRVFLLGAFSGATMALAGEVGKLRAAASALGDAGATAALDDVLELLGAGENGKAGA
jgi:hypothetical protein